MYNNDLYQTFENEHIKYDNRFSYDKQNKDYLESSFKASYRWNYGDTVSLVFAFKEFLNQLEYIDSEGYNWQPAGSGTSTVMIPIYNTYWNNIVLDVNADVNFTIKFYNFRFEDIYEIETTLMSEEPIQIDRETSQTLFKKGIYYCGVELNYEGNYYTIVTPENCLIYVD